jgi:oxygen-dependent protoporphyrinogen oxidase
MRVAIIGGGIAGLACAYELEKAARAGSRVEYELFEASGRLGGVISSAIVEGTLIERGPDSFLTEKPAGAELCRELGLGRDLIDSNDAERKTFIVVRNRLVPLPDGLMFLIPTKLIATALTPLFSLWTKLRMAWELNHPPRPKEGDESVATLVRRHFGQQVVDRLADPLLSGIYGGDAAKLSAQSVLPRLVDMEEKYGSLTRGMLEGMRASKAAAGEQIPEPKPIFTTLRFGMEQVVDALVARLDPARLHLRSPVTTVSREGDGWLVRSGDSAQRFDAIVIATPAWAAAELIREVDSELAGELSAIPYSSSITVNLVFDGSQLDPLPDGFGFLVPAVEGRAMLACTILNRKFLGRTAPGRSVLRVFLGGSRNAALLDQTDESLVELVRRELFEILQISALPELTEVQRWPRAMAQYAVGHKARQERIKDRLAIWPGLALIGNAYDGIGISDCIRLGRSAARKLAEASKPQVSTPQDAQAIAQSHT